VSLAQQSASAEALSALRDENRRLRSLLDFSREVTAERDLRAQMRLVNAELRRTIGCVAAAAHVTPVLRAIRVDPLVVLRHD